jgi:hypothetical protein
MRLNQHGFFCNPAAAAVSAVILAAAFSASGCYQKSSGSGTDCDPDVRIELSEAPVMEERPGCPNPVYMTLEYKVSNAWGKRILIDKVDLEAVTMLNSETFFEWEYIDTAHTYLDSGRFYIVPFDGILVSAVIEHTPSFEYGEGLNTIRATLSFHIDEDASCTEFQVSDEVAITTVLNPDACPIDN